MGRLFEKMLTLSGYQVRILEKEDWARAADIVADAGMSYRQRTDSRHHCGDDRQAAAPSGGLHSG